eukprot:TRINITY_DN265_c0_g1_i3.p1 TRINITY_DN265_c0_g1~~TRINITY_DN265_c0_g1_i3.p1  ORF type:complete len:366 (-),score=118.85 TRINITY_DN265_c0_g1_i3:101-1198(-)
MFASRNELVIRLDDKEYFGGDTVTGNIELQIIGAPLKVRNVKWHLNVTEHMMSPESDVKKAQKLHKKNSRRAKPAEHNIMASPVLHSPPLRGSGLFGDRSRGRGLLRDEDEVLSEGMHKFPFSFELPDRLPPSFRYGSRGLLQYEIWAEVVQSKGKPLKACRALRVGGSIYDEDFVRLNAQPSTLSTTKDITFPGLGEGRVDMMATINRSVFVVGDQLSARIVIGNHSSKNIEKVKAQLRMHVHYVGDSHKRHIVQQWTSSTSISPYEGQQGYEFRLPVPEEIPGTIVTRKTADSIKIGTLINVSYYLTVRVKLGMRKLKLKLPVTILRPDPKYADCFGPVSEVLSPPGTSASFMTSPPALRPVC